MAIAIREMERELKEVTDAISECLKGRTVVWDNRTVSHNDLDSLRRHRAYLRREIDRYQHGPMRVARFIN